MPSVAQTQLRDVDLPAYSVNSRPRITEHLSHLSKGGHRWLTLSIHDQTEDHRAIPTFIEGQEIAGTVKLDLNKDVFIKAITVSLSGALSTKMGVERFILLSKQLYGPHSTTDRPPDNLWQFSFTLPKGIRVVLTDGKPRNFKLPPTVHDKANKTHVEYQIGVSVVRGQFSSEHKIYVPIQYVPVSRPTPTRLPVSTGPDEGNAGWKTLKCPSMKGILADKQAANLDYTISIPEPLCYTRGFTIPISISITSSDANPLDIIPASSTPLIRLDRHVCLDSLDSLVALSTFNSWESPAREVCRATWSEPVVEQHLNDHPRLTFYGELDIPQDIPPTCNILNMQLEYAISLYPSKFAGFTPAVSQSKAVLSEQVEIATALACRPQVQLAAAPPEYA